MKNWLVVLLLIACGVEARDRCRDVRTRSGDCAVFDAGITFDLNIPLTSSDECECQASVNATIFGGASTAVSTARSTGAFCTRGILSRVMVTDAGGYISGISPDAGMVFCAANKMRVMQGSTSGYGVLSEMDMLNYVYGSRTLGGPDWSIAGIGGASAPVLTSNAGLGPDGTMVAERIEFPATTGDLGSGERSILFPAVANVPPPSVCNGQKTSCSAKVMNYSYVDGGTIVGLVATGTDGPGGYRTLRCPIQSETSYTWCFLENLNVTSGGGGSFVLGSVSYYDGTDYPASDVLIDQLQCECNDHPTSYYPTAQGAVATREEDSITGSIPFVPVGSDLTLAAEVATIGTIQASRSVVSLENTLTGGSGTDYFNLGVGSARELECNKLVSNVTETVNGSAYAAAGANVVSCSFDGFTSLSACLNGSCNTDTVTSHPTRSFTLGIGAEWSGAAWINQVQDVVKSVSVTSSARKILILIGDSIIAGTFVNADARPHNVIHAYTGNKLAVENRGVGGYEIEESHELFDQELANVVAAGLQSRTTIVVASGTNSAPAPDDGGTAVVNVVWHLKQMYYAGWDAGVPTYVTTIVPRGDSMSFVVGVNDGLYDAGLNPIDSYTPTINDAGTALADLCGQGDGVHLTDAGTHAGLIYPICLRTQVCSVPEVTCR